MTAANCTKTDKKQTHKDTQIQHNRAPAGKTISNKLFFEFDSNFRLNQFQTCTGKPQATQEGCDVLCTVLF